MAAANPATFAAKPNAEQSEQPRHDFIIGDNVNSWPHCTFINDDNKDSRVSEQTLVWMPYGLKVK